MIERLDFKLSHTWRSGLISPTHSLPVEFLGSFFYVLLLLVGGAFSLCLSTPSCSGQVYFVNDRKCGIDEEVHQLIYPVVTPTRSHSYSSLASSKPNFPPSGSGVWCAGPPLHHFARRPGLRLSLPAFFPAPGSWKASLVYGSVSYCPLKVVKVSQPPSLLRLPRLVLTVSLTVEPSQSPPYLISSLSIIVSHVYHLVYVLVLVCSSP